MDQKPFNQLLQPSMTAKFVVPSVQSSSLGSVPGGQISQQPPHVLASPTQSVGKVLTPGYPTTTTPSQTVAVKAEPGLTPMADTTALPGTTISIKEETPADFDQKPELNAVGNVLTDVPNTPSELDDPNSLIGAGMDPVKSETACSGSTVATKAPIAKKGKPFTSSLYSSADDFHSKAV